MLNALFLRSIGEQPLAARNATAILLLPSPKVPPPAPTSFDGEGAAGDFPDSDWDRETLEKVHRWLFAIIGQRVDASSLRAGVETGVKSPAHAKKTRTALGKVGEGAMYI